MANKLRSDWEILEKQLDEYTKGGLLLKNVFSVSARHPFLSVLFVVVFGLFTNILSRLVHTWVTNQNPIHYPLWAVALMLIYLAIMVAILAYLRHRHKDRFKRTTLNRKRALVTLVSPRNDGDYSSTPALQVINALLYTENSKASINALERVILVATESADAIKTAENLKENIMSKDRSVEICTISVNNHLMSEIQQQLESLVGRLLLEFQSHEIVADYTGGTKPMSIAVMRVCEKHLILPIYLDSGDRQHSV